MNLNVEQNIKILLAEADYLLKQDSLSINEFKKYKKQVDSVIIELLKESDVDKDLLQIVLERKLETSPKSWIGNKIHYYFNLKFSFSLNAPFLLKHDETSKIKTYIFWTKQSLNKIITFSTA